MMKNIGGTAFRILYCRNTSSRRPNLVTPFRMPVKSHVQGRCWGGNGMADHQTLFMPRLRGRDFDTSHQVILRTSRCYVWPI